MVYRRKLTIIIELWEKEEDTSNTNWVEFKGRIANWFNENEFGIWKLYSKRGFQQAKVADKDFGIEPRKKCIYIAWLTIKNNHPVYDVHTFHTYVFDDDDEIRDSLMYVCVCVCCRHVL